MNPRNANTGQALVPFGTSPEAAAPFDTALNTSLNATVDGSNLFIPNKYKHLKGNI